MTLRTAFVLPSFAGGGAERAVLTLVGELNSSRVAPSLVLLDGRGPLRDLVPDAVEMIDLGRPRMRTAWPALLVALRRLRPDAVVSTLGYVNIAVLAMRQLLPGRPIVVVREANAPSASFAAVRWPGLMRRTYRTLYPRAEAVLCNAQSTAEQLITAVGVPRERLHHLPNPVDVNGLRARAIPLERTSGSGPRFVAAGRLTRQKGFDRLLDMMAGMPADAALTVLGEGSERAALELQAARLGLDRRIHFLGFKPVPWPHYAGADAFLLSSRWEGQSNAALEALACGTPVIAAPDAGGIMEVAEVTPPGAVTVAQCGPPFAEAMAAIAPEPPDRVRRSLLPSGFLPSEVAEMLTRILEAAALAPELDQRAVQG